MAIADYLKLLFRGIWLSMVVAVFMAWWLIQMFWIVWYATLEKVLKDDE